MGASLITGRRYSPLLSIAIQRGSCLVCLHHESFTHGHTAAQPCSACSNQQSGSAQHILLPGRSLTLGLFHRCTPPRPQGPIEIAKGAGSISFTNVLPKQATFSLAVDNPAFVVKASETIAAKKSCQVAIAMSKDTAGQAAIGRLTISCPAETTATWTYYLRSTI